MTTERKLIRPTYPLGFSIGLLTLIFVFSFFLSQQIFDVSIHDLKENKHVYIGMFLVTIALIIMILIIWEEFLFPIKVKEINGGLVFRNHRTKLKTQLLFYCFIPAIFIYIYFEYEVNIIRFAIWAAICIIAPVVEKIGSGINNYNDFLKLTKAEIEYKNNEKEGCYKITTIQNIVVVKDEGNVIQKIKLRLIEQDSVIIDLDEMELDAFYDSIQRYINKSYKHLVIESQVQA